MRGRRGIAQLLVLWALLLLGTLALGFSLSMRTEAQAARNGVDDVRAYFQARTGIMRTVALLSTVPAGRLNPEQEELQRLRKENLRLKMEREILKKAAAFFANESK